jgi:hypothetical protein
MYKKKSKKKKRREGRRERKEQYLFITILFIQNIQKKMKNRTKCKVCLNNILFPTILVTESSQAQLMTLYFFLFYFLLYENHLSGSLEWHSGFGKRCCKNIQQSVRKKKTLVFILKGIKNMELQNVKNDCLALV